jgi:uncharacterized damage-inducible protein DinB
MALKDALLVEYDHETATTRKLLERIPAAALAWRPHPRSMTIGGLGQHLSNLPTWGGLVLDRVELDLQDVPARLPEPVSVDQILARFDDVRPKTRTSLDRTDAELLALWTLKRNGAQMFSLPRAAAFRSFVLNHMIHHRGQLSVYLRLNDVPVPAIYGPSADEG